MLARTPTYSPMPPWTDGQQVTRVEDGVLFLYDADNNCLTVDANVSGIVKDAGGFIVTNLPTPTVGSDAANKDYVDSAGGGSGGGITDAPSDGFTYSRRNSAWIHVVDGGTY